MHGVTECVTKYNLAFEVIFEMKYVYCMKICNDKSAYNVCTVILLSR